jgi:small subunit ribosomal protein S21
MLIVKVQGSIDKAVKLLKKKFDSTGVVKQLRERRDFKKKSVKRREVIKRAIYIQNLKSVEDGDQ